MSLARFFTTLVRDDGTKTAVMTEGRPDWLHDAVRAVHGNDLPNDWVYQECRAACEAIDDGSLTEDSDGEYADGAVDIYTKDLYQWAADMCHTDTYAEAEAEASDLDGVDDDALKRITITQYCAIRRIAVAMLSAVEGNREDMGGAR